MSDDKTNDGDGKSLEELAGSIHSCGTCNDARIEDYLGMSSDNNSTSRVSEYLSGFKSFVANVVVGAKKLVGKYDPLQESYEEAVKIVCKLEEIKGTIHNHLYGEEDFLETGKVGGMYGQLNDALDSVKYHVEEVIKYSEETGLSPKERHENNEHKRDHMSRFREAKSDAESLVKGINLLVGNYSGIQDKLVEAKNALEKFNPSQRFNHNVGYLADRVNTFFDGELELKVPASYKLQSVKTTS
ncbi:hypothetical protein HOC35_07340 [Candidatus Woesearchaeota archaeon]|jgi:hypothetical protein|nr:hypothetical protein [Candidatus Woesearchaeota archaeon]